MRITVTRSGGFAGMRRQWSVEPAGPEEDRWRALVDACPWDRPEVPEAALGPGVGPRPDAATGQGADAGRGADAGQGADASAAPPAAAAPGPAGRAPVRDGFTYTFEAADRRATLSESAVVGPWRTLAEEVRESADG